MCCIAGGESSAKDRATPFPGKGRWDETQQAKLKRKIGQQTPEIDCSKSACNALRNSGWGRP
jgi:hypothetical protein